MLVELLAERLALRVGRSSDHEVEGALTNTDAAHAVRHTHDG